ncbi:hypothetical protein PILCRDRAFT_707860 [Piloderma croceum F 1598]|uniref:Uncharacterized protein n=1 Tax=Piloderma croceum (strain F 1598) TaxID=765440 RepID=A0A0C3F2N6_PILCF|nr:hypothetical protein PILCRDRAFT_707860 [Piloderma croceum F 1598]
MHFHFPRCENLGIDGKILNTIMHFPSAWHVIADFSRHLCLHLAIVNVTCGCCPIKWDCWTGQSGQRHPPCRSSNFQDALMEDSCLLKSVTVRYTVVGRCQLLFGQRYYSPDILSFILKAETLPLDELLLSLLWLCVRYI